LSRKWRVNILEFDAVDQIMNDILDFSRKLFDTEAWPARPSRALNSAPNRAARASFILSATTARVLT